MEREKWAFEVLRKEAMFVRMSWMSVSWAISAALGWLDLPECCLNTPISAGIPTPA